MNYTLHQLHVFLKITKTLSITKAAEELHLSQPAVSIQLRNFQDQFEIPLTEVVGRQLYVTDFGKEIAESAQNIVDQVNQIDHKTMAYKGQLFGRLKISSVSTGKYLMPYFLTEFIHTNPGVELSLDVTNKARVMASLEKNELDFALVSVLPDGISVHTIDLTVNQLFLVAPYNLDIEDKLYDMSILEEVPLIFRENGSGTRFVGERFIKEHGLQVKKKLILTSNEAVKQAVVAGLGLSIMPLIGLKNELRDKQLKIIPVKGLPVSSAWQLIWLKEKKLSPSTLAYKTFLEENKSRIIEEQFGWLKEYREI